MRVCFVCVCVYSVNMCITQKVTKRRQREKDGKSAHKRPSFCRISNTGVPARSLFTHNECCFVSKLLLEHITLYVAGSELYCCSLLLVTKGYKKYVSSPTHGGPLHLKTTKCQTKKRYLSVIGHNVAICAKYLCTERKGCCSDNTGLSVPQYSII